MSKRRDSNGKSKRVYQATDIFEGFMCSLGNLGGASLDTIVVLGWMTRCITHAKSQIIPGYGGMLDRYYAQLEKEAKSLRNMIAMGSAISATHLPKSVHDNFELLPKAALDQLLAWLIALVDEQLQIGQAEANRLDKGHSGRSKGKDPIREQLLEWTHRRRLPGAVESRDATWRALEAHCKNEGIANPWQDLTRHFQDLAEWRGRKGLGTGKRGRPPGKKQIGKQ